MSLTRTASRADLTPKGSYAPAARAAPQAGSTRHLWWSANYRQASIAALSVTLTGYTFPGWALLNFTATDEAIVDPKDLAILVIPPSNTVGSPFSIARLKLSAPKVSAAITGTNDHALFLRPFKIPLKRPPPPTQQMIAEGGLSIPLYFICFLISSIIVECPS